MWERKIYRNDMLRCTICHDSPCSKVCEHYDPGRLLRSIWFDNEKAAAASLPERNCCIGCDRPCEKACVRPDEVHIADLITRLYDEVKPELEVAMPEDESRLETDFLGVKLDSPFLLSSSVIASTYDMCARAFEAGWAGASFKTVCNIQIYEASPRFSAITGDSNTIIGFKNIEQLSDHSVEENMAIFRKLKENYPNKFILASIMGTSEDEWTYLAGECARNGADAIELNFSCPNMMEGGLGSDIGQTPEAVEIYTRAARRGTDIPIIAKLTPNVTRMSPAAEAAIRGGADGITAINTIKSVIGVNPYTYVFSPAVKGKSAIGGYSGNAVKPIALRFIAEIANNEKLKGKHISGIGGIETWMDALEFILLGSDSVQATTAIMQYGYRIIEDLKSGLNYYMAENGISNVRELTGQALPFLSETTETLERNSIIYPSFDRSKCIGCGRCVLSCRDGGHQALRLNDQHKPIMDPKRCVGCHLCLLVCPQRAIVNNSHRIQKQ